MGITMRSLRWQPIVTPLLALAGIGVSVYLTIVHYDSGALVCPATGSVVNCEKVVTSPQSVIFGVPVPIFGLAYFGAMFGLCLPMMWRSRDRRIHLARLALAVAGMGMVIYLIFAELFLVKAICLWCTSVHVLTFVLFVTILTSTETLWDRSAKAEPSRPAQAHASARGKPAPKAAPKPALRAGAQSPPKAGTKPAPQAGTNRSDRPKEKVGTRPAPAPSKNRRPAS
jgi:uncharacterized membrane protein